MYRNGQENKQKPSKLQNKKPPVSQDPRRASPPRPRAAAPAARPRRPDSWWQDLLENVIQMRQTTLSYFVTNFDVLMLSLRKQIDKHCSDRQTNGHRNNLRQVNRSLMNATKRNKQARATRDGKSIQMKASESKPVPKTKPG